MISIESGVLTVTLTLLILIATSVVVKRRRQIPARPDAYYRERELRWHEAKAQWNAANRGPTATTEWRVFFFNHLLDTIIDPQWREFVSRCERP